MYKEKFSLNRDKFYFLTIAFFFPHLFRFCVVLRATFRYLLEICEEINSGIAPPGGKKMREPSVGQ